MTKGTKWNDALIRQAASKYTSRSEFAYKNKPAYEAARIRGLLDELFNLTLNQWTDANVRTEALKYRSRTEFARQSNSAYNAARRLGILHDLYGHKLTLWDIDRVEDVASRCDSKKDMKRKSGSAYNAALRLGIIDRLFDNQGRVRSRDAVYLWSVKDEPGLYKFGITSWEMGDYRIKQVAGEAGFTPVLILLEQVGYEGAKILEALMRNKGTPYVHPKKFYGRTEFRYMSPTQVGECITAIKEYRQLRGI